MNTIEFGKACKPYNAQYKKLFNVIPCPANYACTREEFFEALIKAVDSRQPIEIFLQKAAVPSEPGAKY